MVRNSSGTQQFHLQRCGPAATRPECADFICFHWTVTTIGRIAAQSDYVLCSADRTQNCIVSRRHARVIRTGNPEVHLLRDDSRNGIFVNDVKITSDPTQLCEGDTVTFAHPSGEHLDSGTRFRQPDSEYQFIFKRCFCPRPEDDAPPDPESQGLRPGLKSQEGPGDAFILSPVPRGRSQSRRLPEEARHRDPTLCIDGVSRTRQQTVTAAQSDPTLPSSAKVKCPSKTSQTVTVQTSEPSKPSEKPATTVSVGSQTPEKVPPVESENLEDKVETENSGIAKENVGIQAGDTVDSAGPKADRDSDAAAVKKSKTSQEKEETEESTSNFQISQDFFAASQGFAVDRFASQTSRKVSPVKQVFVSEQQMLRTDELLLEPVLPGPSDPALTVAQPQMTESEATSAVAQPQTAEPEGTCVEMQPQVTEPEATSVETHPQMAEPEAISVEMQPQVTESEATFVVMQPQTAEPEGTSVEMQPQMTEPEATSVPEAISAVAQPQTAKSDGTSVEMQPYVTAPEATSVETQLQPEGTSVEMKPQESEQEAASVEMQPQMAEPDATYVETRPQVTEPEATSVEMQLLLEKPSKEPGVICVDTDNTAKELETSLDKATTEISSEPLVKDHESTIVKDENEMSSTAGSTEDEEPDDDNDNTSTAITVSQISLIPSDLEVTRDDTDMSTQEVVNLQDSSRTLSGDNNGSHDITFGSTGADVGYALMESTPIRGPDHNRTITDVRTSQSTRDEFSDEDDCYVTADGTAMFSSATSRFLDVTEEFGLEPVAPKNDNGRVEYDPPKEMSGEGLMEEVTTTSNVTVVTSRLEDVRSVVTMPSHVAVVTIPKANLQQVAALNSGVTLLSVENRTLGLSLGQTSGAKPLAEDLGGDVVSVADANVIKEGEGEGRRHNNTATHSVVPPSEAETKRDAMADIVKCSHNRESHSSLDDSDMSQELSMEPPRGYRRIASKFEQTAAQQRLQQQKESKDNLSSNQPVVPPQSLLNPETKDPTCASEQQSSKSTSPAEKQKEPESSSFQASSLLSAQVQLLPGIEKLPELLQKDKQEENNNEIENMVDIESIDESVAMPAAEAEREGAEPNKEDEEEEETEEKTEDQHLNESKAGILQQDVLVLGQPETAAEVCQPSSKGTAANQAGVSTTTQEQIEVEVIVIDTDTDSNDRSPSGEEQASVEECEDYSEEENGSVVDLQSLEDGSDDGVIVIDDSSADSPQVCTYSDSKQDQSIAEDEKAEISATTIDIDASVTEESMPEDMKTTTLVTNKETTSEMRKENIAVIEDTGPERTTVMTEDTVDMKRKEKDQTKSIVTKETTVVEEDTPVLARESVLVAAEEVTSLVTEDIPEVTRVEAEEAIPVMTEDITPVEDIPVGIEEVTHVVTEEVPPVVAEEVTSVETEEVAPVEAEEVALVVTEEVIPVVTEVVTPVEAEEVTSVEAEEATPVVAEEIMQVKDTPVVTEKVAPVEAEEVAPVVTDVIPLVTEEVTPVEADEVTSVEAEGVTSVEDTSVVAEEVAPVEQTPALTEEATPVVAEKVTPVVTEEIRPVVTEEVTTAVTEEATPVVIEEVTPAVTEEATHVVTEKVTPVVTVEVSSVVTVEATPEGSEATPEVTEETTDVTPEETTDVTTVVTEETTDITPVLMEEATPEGSEATPIVTEETTDVTPVMMEEATPESSDVAPEVTEETADVRPVVTEKTIDFIHVVTEETAEVTPVVTEETPEVTPVVPEDTTDVTPVVTEETTDVTPVVTEETAEVTSVVPEETTDVTPVMMEEATPESSDVAPEVTEETADVRPVVTEETTDVTPVVTEETTDVTPVVTEQTTDGTPVVTEETTDVTPVVTEETTDVTPVVTEQTTDGTPVVTEETTDVTPVVTEETTDVTPVVTEVTTDVSPVVTEETTYFTPVVTEETTDVTPVVTEETTDVTPVVTEETTDVTPVVTEETTDVTPVVTEETTDFTPVVTEETTDVTPVVTEETTDFTPVVTEETTDVTPVVTEGTADVTPVVTEETTDFTPVVTEETTDVTPVVTEETTDFTPVVTEETTDVTPVVTEETAGVTPVVTEETADVTPVVTEETTDVTPVVTEETTDITPVVIEEATPEVSEATPVVTEETTDVSSVVTEDTTDGTPVVTEEAITLVSEVDPVVAEQVSSVVAEEPPVQPQQASWMLDDDILSTQILRCDEQETHSLQDSLETEEGKRESWHWDFDLSQKIVLQLDDDSDEENILSASEEDFTLVESSPAVAKEDPPVVIEANTFPVTEETSSLMTEEVTPVLTVEVTPVVVEGATSVMAEKPMTDETKLEMRENVTPVERDEISPVRTEDASINRVTPVLTEEAIPVVTEEGTPVLKEEATPVVTGKTASVMTEETTEDTSLVTQVTPSTTEEDTHVVTREVTPVMLDEAPPVRTKGDTPIISEEPTITMEKYTPVDAIGGEVVREEIRAEESSPVGTNDVMLTESHASDEVPEAAVPVVTEKATTTSEEKATPIIPEAATNPVMEGENGHVLEQATLSVEGATSVMGDKAPSVPKDSKLFETEEATLVVTEVVPVGAGETTSTNNRETSQELTEETKLEERPEVILTETDCLVVKDSIAEMTEEPTLKEARETTFEARPMVTEEDESEEIKEVTTAVIQETTPVEKEETASIEKETIPVLSEEHSSAATGVPQTAVPTEGTCTANEDTASLVTAETTMVVTEAIPREEETMIEPGNGPISAHREDTQNSETEKGDTDDFCFVVNVPDSGEKARIPTDVIEASQDVTLKCGAVLDESKILSIERISTPVKPTDGNILNECRDALLECVEKVSTDAPSSESLAASGITGSVKDSALSADDADLAESIPSTDSPFGQMVIDLEASDAEEIPGKKFPTIADIDSNDGTQELPGSNEMESQTSSERLTCAQVASRRISEHSASSTASESLIAPVQPRLASWMLDDDILSTQNLRCDERETRSSKEGFEAEEAKRESCLRDFELSQKIVLQLDEDSDVENILSSSDEEMTPIEGVKPFSQEAGSSCEEQLTVEGNVKTDTQDSGPEEENILSSSDEEISLTDGVKPFSQEDESSCMNLLQTYSEKPQTSRIGVTDLECSQPGMGSLTCSSETNSDAGSENLCDAEATCNSGTEEKPEEREKVEQEGDICGMNKEDDKTAEEEIWDSETCINRQEPSTDKTEMWRPEEQSEGLLSVQDSEDVEKMADQVVLFLSDDASAQCTKRLSASQTQETFEASESEASETDDEIDPPRKRQKREAREDNIDSQNDSKDFGSAADKNLAFEGSSGSEENQVVLTASEDTNLDVAADDADQMTNTDVNMKPPGDTDKVLEVLDTEEQPDKMAEEVVEEQPDKVAEKVVKESPDKVAEEVVGESPHKVNEKVVYIQSEEVLEEQSVDKAAEKVKEQSVDKVTEEVVEESVDKVVEEVVEEQPDNIDEEVPEEQSVGKAAEVLEEKSVDKVTEEVLTEQSVDEEVKEHSDKVMEEVVEKMSGKAAKEVLEEQSVDKVIQEVVEEQPDNIAEVVLKEKSVDRAAEEVVKDQPVDKATEEVVEQSVDKGTEEVPEEQSVDEATEEVPEEQSVDKVAEEVPEEQSVDKAAEEVPEEQSVDKATEKVLEEQSVHKAAGEVSEEQSVHKAAGEVPEEQSVHKVAEEVPEEQSVDKATEEVPEEQSVHKAGGEVPEEQSVDKAVGEVPEEQSVDKAAGEVPEEQSVDKAVGKVPEEQSVDKAVGEVPEEQPVDKAAGEVLVEQSFNKAAEEVAAEHPDKVTEEVLEEKPVDKATEEALEEQSFDRVAEEVVEEHSVDKAAEKVAAEVPEEQSIDKATEEVLEEQSVDKANEKVLEEEPDKVAEKALEKQPVGKVAEEVSEGKFVDKAAGEVLEKQSVGKVADKIVGGPDEDVIRVINKLPVDAVSGSPRTRNGQEKDSTSPSARNHMPNTFKTVPIVFVKDPMENRMPSSHPRSRTSSPFLPIHPARNQSPQFQHSSKNPEAESKLQDTSSDEHQFSDAESEEEETIPNPWGSSRQETGFAGSRFGVAQPKARGVMARPSPQKRKASEDWVPVPYNKKTCYTGSALSSAGRVGLPRSAEKFPRALSPGLLKQRCFAGGNSPLAKPRESQTEEPVPRKRQKLGFLASDPAGKGEAPTGINMSGSSQEVTTSQAAVEQSLRSLSKKDSQSQAPGAMSQAESQRESPHSVSQTKSHSQGSESMSQRESKHQTPKTVSPAESQNQSPESQGEAPESVSQGESQSESSESVNQAESKSQTPESVSQAESQSPAPESVNQADSAPESMSQGESQSQTPESISPAESQNQSPESQSPAPESVSQAESQGQGPESMSQGESQSQTPEFVSPAESQIQSPESQSQAPETVSQAVSQGQGPESMSQGESQCQTPETMSPGESQNQSPESQSPAPESVSQAESQGQGPESMSQGESQCQTPETMSPAESQNQLPESQSQAPETVSQAVSQGQGPESMSQGESQNQSPESQSQAPETMSQGQGPESMSQGESQCQTPETMSPAESQNQSPESSSLSPESVGQAGSQSHGSKSVSEADSQSQGSESQSEAPESQSLIPESVDQAESQNQSPDLESESPETARQAESQSQAPGSPSEIPEIESQPESHSHETVSPAESQTQSPESPSQQPESDTQAESQSQAPETLSLAESQSQSPVSPSEIPEIESQPESHSHETVSQAESQTQSPESPSQQPESDTQAESQSESPVSHHETPEIVSQPESHSQSPETASQMESQSEAPESMSQAESQTQSPGSHSETPKMVSQPESQSETPESQRETPETASQAKSQSQSPELQHQTLDTESQAESQSQASRSVSQPESQLREGDISQDNSQCDSSATCEQASARTGYERNSQEINNNSATKDFKIISPRENPVKATWPADSCDKTQNRNVNAIPQLADDDPVSFLKPSAPAEKRVQEQLLTSSQRGSSGSSGSYQGQGLDLYLNPSQSTQPGSGEEELELQRFLCSPTTGPDGASTGPSKWLDKMASSCDLEDLLLSQELVVDKRGGRHAAMAQPGSQKTLQQGEPSEVLPHCGLATGSSSQEEAGTLKALEIPLPMTEGQMLDLALQMIRSETKPDPALLATLKMEADRVVKSEMVESSSLGMSESHRLESDTKGFLLDARAIARPVQTSQADSSRDCSPDPNCAFETQDGRQTADQESHVDCFKIRDPMSSQATDDSDQDDDATADSFNPDDAARDDIIQASQDASGSCLAQDESNPLGLRVGPLASTYKLSAASTECPNINPDSMQFSPELGLPQVSPSEDIIDDALSCNFDDADDFSSVDIDFGAIESQDSELEMSMLIPITSHGESEKQSKTSESISTLGSRLTRSQKGSSSRHSKAKRKRSTSEEDEDDVIPPSLAEALPDLNQPKQSFKKLKNKASSKKIDSDSDSDIFKDGSSSPECSAQPTRTKSKRFVVKKKRSRHSESSIAGSPDKFEFMSSTQPVRPSTSYETSPMALSQPVRGRRPSGRLATILQKLQKHAEKPDPQTPPELPEEPVETESSQETPGSQSGYLAARQLFARDGSETPEVHVQRASEMLDKLRELMFSSKREVTGLPRVQAWLQDMRALQSKLTLPQTVIAVVGGTGSGKSSIMNALLDHSSILPTSGLRACTAAVVEVSTVDGGTKYEAEIEFLSQEEWEAELKILLTQLSKEGKVKARQPSEQKPEEEVAWHKLRAVYGRFKDGVTLEKLRRKTDVTRMLGRVLKLKDSSAEKFQRQASRYIQATENGKGGDYWPIVKQVKLRLPRCPVLNSGAVLVDLPGIRDSNAARDRIAKEYLKKCTAVWVVASIHRAVDDKTAKDLLGEHFRRQLLMDGQYGSISFICTKTDDIVPSEIKRALNLDEIDPLEAEIEEKQVDCDELDKMNRRTRREIDRVEMQVNKAQDDYDGWKDEVQSAQDDYDEDDPEWQKAMESLRQHLADSKMMLRGHQREVQQLKDTVRGYKQEKMELNKAIESNQQKIAAICARARNEYAQNQIRRDFRAGMREMKRQAGLDVDEEDSDDEDEEEMDMRQTVDNLKVFSVSAMEYLKMTHKLSTGDGKAQVFSNKEDTGVPGLQKYIQEVTQRRREQAAVRILSSVAQFIANVYNYLQDEGTKDKALRGSAQSSFKSQLAFLESLMKPVVDQARRDLEETFSAVLKPKVTEGREQAVATANKTVAKWAAPQNRENKQAGGLHVSTYKAVCRYDGQFRSPTYGPIDFNQDLASPIYASITIVWDRVFNMRLSKILSDCQTGIKAALEKFSRRIKRDLMDLGMSAARVDRVLQQHMVGANARLTELMTMLKETIANRQREANRALTPAVQSNMLPTYQMCASEAGSGMFARIKNMVARHVDRRKVEMFTEASRILLIELDDLQSTIITEVEMICGAMVADLTPVYEPLWETPTTSYILREVFLPGVENSCEECRCLLRDAGVENTIDALMVPASTPGTSVAERTKLLPRGSPQQSKTAGKISTVATAVPSCSTDRKPGLASRSTLDAGVKKPFSPGKKPFSPGKKIADSTGKKHCSPGKKYPSPGKAATKRKRIADPRSPSSAKSRNIPPSFPDEDESLASKTNKKLKLSLKNSPTRRLTQVTKPPASFPSPGQSFPRPQPPAVKVKQEPMDIAGVKTEAPSGEQARKQHRKKEAVIDLTMSTTEEEDDSEDEVFPWLPGKNTRYK